MRFLFSTSKKPVSKLIRWGLGTDCSHFALAFDEGPSGKGIVFHSRLQGVGIDWFSLWSKENKIIHALEFKEKLEPEIEEMIYLSIVERYIGKPYDQGAFAYWSLMVLKKKLVGGGLPSRNLWGSKGSFLCTALAEALREAPINCPELVGVKDLEILSPCSLFKILSTSPSLQVCS